MRLCGVGLKGARVGDRGTSEKEAEMTVLMTR